MNINLGIAQMGAIQESLQDTIDENAGVIINGLGEDLTGRVALVMPDDLRGSGAYQVWHEMVSHGGRTGWWIWVDDEGVPHYSCHPTDAGHEEEG